MSMTSSSTHNGSSPNPAARKAATMSATEVARYHQRLASGDNSHLPSRPSVGITRGSVNVSAVLASQAPKQVPKYWKPEGDSTAALTASTLASQGDEFSASLWQPGQASADAATAALYARDRDLNKPSQVVGPTMSESASAAALHAQRTPARETAAKHLKAGYEFSDRVESNAPSDAWVHLAANKADQAAADLNLAAQSSAAALRQTPEQMVSALDISKIESIARDRARKTLSGVYGNDYNPTSSAQMAARAQVLQSQKDRVKEANHREDVLSSANVFQIAAERVQRQLAALTKDAADRSIYGTEKDRQAAFTIANSNYEKRNINSGKINIGGGLYMTQNEIDEIARQHVQPVLRDVSKIAEDRRRADEEAAAEQQAMKEAREEQKARERSEKEAEKAAKEERKAQEKAAREERKAQEKAAKEERKAQEKAEAAAAAEAKAAAAAEAKAAKEAAKEAQAAEAAKAAEAAETDEPAAIASASSAVDAASTPAVAAVASTAAGAPVAPAAIPAPPSRQHSSSNLSTKRQGSGFFKKLLRSPSSASSIFRVGAMPTKEDVEKAQEDLGKARIELAATKKEFAVVEQDVQDAIHDHHAAKIQFHDTRKLSEDKHASADVQAKAKADLPQLKEAAKNAKKHRLECAAKMRESEQRVHHADKLVIQLVQSLNRKRKLLGENILEEIGWSEDPNAEASTKDSLSAEQREAHRKTLVELGDELALRKFDAQQAKIDRARAQQAMKNLKGDASEAEARMLDAVRKHRELKEAYHREKKGRASASVSGNQSATASGVATPALDQPVPEGVDAEKVMKLLEEQIAAKTEAEEAKLASENAVRRLEEAEQAFQAAKTKTDLAVEKVADEEEVQKKAEAEVAAAAEAAEEKEAAHAAEAANADTGAPADSTEDRLFNGFESTSTSAAK